MLRYWRSCTAIAALLIYTGGFWIWRSYGFPIGYETCQYAAAYDQKDNCAPYNVYLVVLRKIGEVATDPNFINALITLIAAIVTAAATVYIARFTVTLARVGKQQVADTRILERAYLSAEPFGIKTLTDDPHLVAHVRIINAGNLPAQKVKWRIQTVFSDIGDKRDFEINELDLKGDGILAPKSQMIQGNDDVITEAKMLLEKDRVRRHHGRVAAYLYVFGLIRYEDGFEQSRTTAFCHRYNCMAFNQGRGSMAGEDGRQHQYGNHTT